MDLTNAVPPVSQQFALGIDLGGTNTKFGLVNTHGDIFHYGSISTNTKDAVEDFIDELYDAILPGIKDVGGPEMIRGIGLGAGRGGARGDACGRVSTLATSSISPSRRSLWGQPRVPGSLRHLERTGERIPREAIRMKRSEGRARNRQPVGDAAPAR